MLDCAHHEAQVHDHEADDHGEHEPATYHLLFGFNPIRKGKKHESTEADRQLVEVLHNAISEVFQWIDISLIDQPRQIQEENSEELMDKGIRQVDANGNEDDAADHVDEIENSLAESSQLDSNIENAPSLIDLVWSQVFVTLKGDIDWCDGHEQHGYKEWNDPYHKWYYLSWCRQKHANHDEATSNQELNIAFKVKSKQLIEKEVIIQELFDLVNALVFCLSRKYLKENP